MALIETILFLLLAVVVSGSIARMSGVALPLVQIALGAVRALLHAGVDVPGQVLVIGFDNVPFSRYSRPALSTIAQDTVKAGRLMVSKLLDHGGASAGRSERVPTDLIVRETCGG